jgi:hypothetical protein
MELVSRWQVDSPIPIPGPHLPSRIRKQSRLSQLSIRSKLSNVCQIQAEHPRTGYGAHTKCLEDSSIFRRMCVVGIWTEKEGSCLRTDSSSWQKLTDLPNDKAEKHAVGIAAEELVSRDRISPSLEYSGFGKPLRPTRTPVLWWRHVRRKNRKWQHRFTSNGFLLA